MALRSRDRFEVVKAVLAMAEEQGGVAISAAADALGIDREALLSVLSPLLYMSFRAQTDDEMIDMTYAFEYDEDSDRLSVEQAHWLRDMRSTPPSLATSQRLLLAGLVVRATSTTDDPALEAALAKLEGLSGDIFVFIAEPIVLETVRACVEEETPMRFRYAKAGADAVTERVIEPYKVFQSGWWYVAGKDLGDGEVKYFRVDRMLSAEMTKLPRFTPPADVEVFDRVQVEHLLQRVTVRVPERLRNLLTDDYAVDEVVPLGGGRLEARVGVLGDEQLDYLLVRLGAEAEWVEPELAAATRRCRTTGARGVRRMTRTTSRPRGADARVHGAERVHQHRHRADGSDDVDDHDHHARRRPGASWCSRRRRSRRPSRSWATTSPPTYPGVEVAVTSGTANGLVNQVSGGLTGDVFASVGERRRRSARHRRPPRGATARVRHRPTRADRPSRQPRGSDRHHRPHEPRPRDRALQPRLGMRTSL